MMKLIFLYGPPAVGKLTIAKEIAKATDFKIFHNHLTVDLVETVFEFHSKPFIELTSKFRLEIINKAIKEKIKGMIFTFCYAHPDDKEFVMKIKNDVKKRGGEVLFVQVICDKKELRKRVKAPDRKKFKKISKTNKLGEVLKEYDLFSPVPGVKNLTINNTELSAKKAAKTIIDHYEL